MKNYIFLKNVKHTKHYYSQKYCPYLRKGQYFLYKNKNFYSITSISFIRLDFLLVIEEDKI